MQQKCICAVHSYQLLPPVALLKTGPHTSFGAHKPAAATAWALGRAGILGGLFYSPKLFLPRMATAKYGCRHNQQAVIKCLPTSAAPGMQPLGPQQKCVIYNKQKTNARCIRFPALFPPKSCTVFFIFNIKSDDFSEQVVIHFTCPGNLYQHFCLFIPGGFYLRSKVIKHNTFR